jgi:hypothetical protein
MEKVSLFDLINQSGLFEFTGEENGTPVFTLKKEVKCEVCNKTSEYCECEDHA